MDEYSDPEISPSDCCGSELRFDEQKFIKFHKLYWQIHCNEHIHLGITRLPRDIKSYYETSAAATKEENFSRQVTPLCISEITLQNQRVANHVDVPPDVVQSTEPPNTQLSPRSPDVVAPMICEMTESPESFDSNPVSLTAEETSKQTTLEKRSGSAKVLNREDSSYNTDLAASMNSSTTGRNSSQSSLTSNDECLSGLVTGHDEDALDGTLHVEMEKSIYPAGQQPVDSCGNVDALLCGSGSDSTVTHNSSSSTSTLNASCGSVVGSSNRGPVAGGIDTSVPGYIFLPEDSNASLFFVNNAPEVPQSVPLINTTSTVADHVISQSQMLAGITELENHVRQLLTQLLVSQNPDAVTLDRYINLLSQTVTPPTAVVIHDDPIPVADDHSQDSDWTAEQKTNCIRNLQIANSCADALCSDDNCSFWKEMIEDIESSVRNNNVNNLQHQILNIIANHAADCSEIFCCVPWCLFYTHCERSDRRLQHAALRNYYRAIDFQSEMNLITQNYDSPGPAAAAAAAGGGCDGDDEAEQPEFIQIDSRVAWPSIEFEYDRPYPVVQLDFSLHYVSLIKQGRIQCHGQSYTIPPRHLLIEQYTLMEGGASVEMWRRFKEAGGQHRNIVGYFWCLLIAPIVKVCVDCSHVLEDRNLQNCLRQHGRTYSWPLICRYVHGLVSATQFLHDAGILFLRWTASSIYVSADDRHAMLGDLSCAVHLETILEDRDTVDVVKYCLPPHIIPPEMFSGDIDFSGDVWGIGCLLYEVVNSGLPLHYQHRHLPRDELRDYVENYDINKFQRTMTNDLLQQIFVVDNDRITLNDVAAYLEDRMDCD